MQSPRADLDITLPPRPFLAPVLPHPVVPYSPSPVVAPAFAAGLTGAGVGLFLSAIKNSLEPHSKGALGVFTRTGWIAGYFAAAGFAFSAVDHSVANLVSSQTSGVAGAAGGCAAGFIMGIRSGSIPTAMGMCGFLGASIATYDLAGGQLGWESGTKDRKTREKERLEFFKKRSLPETVEE